MFFYDMTLTRCVYTGGGDGSVLVSRLSCFDITTSYGERYVKLTHTRVSYICIHVHTNVLLYLKTKLYKV